MWKMLFKVGLHFPKSLLPVCAAVSVADSSDPTYLAAPANASHVTVSAPSSPSASESKSKISSKWNRDLSPRTEAKKTSMFSSLGHKLAKTKPKADPSSTFNVPEASYAEHDQGMWIVKLTILNSLTCLLTFLYPSPYNGKNKNDFCLFIFVMKAITCFDISEVELHYSMPMITERNAADFRCVNYL